MADVSPYIMEQFSPLSSLGDPRPAKDFNSYQIPLRTMNCIAIN